MILRTRLSIFRLCWFGVLIGWASLAAQPGLRLIQQEGSRIGFRNELNTYAWQWDVNKGFQIHPRWTIALVESFRASMLRLSDEKKWKDDQNLQVGVLARLSPLWQLTGLVQSVSFIDKQTGLNNDIHTHRLQAGVQVTPSPRMQLNLGVGPKWDYRFQREDTGLSYVMDGSAREIDIASYLHSASLLLDEDIFHERRNSNQRVLYQVGKTFAPGTADTLHLFTYRRRNDNYTSALGDFESLRENTRGLQNVLGYQLAAGARLRLHSGLQFRDVEVASYADAHKQKSRRRNDQMAENGLALFAHGHRWHTASHLTYQSLSQKYDIDVTDLRVPFSQRTAFITPNNSSQRLSWAHEVGARLGRTDSLFTSGAMSLFRYDTPDTNNFDDRDEWRAHLQVIYHHRFSAVLWMEILSSVNLYHMVYLFGERSADNNWNRIARLRPGLYYEPTPGLRWYQSFEVLANYVDYDFESSLSVLRSYVFRKFSMDDSLRWRFSQNTFWSVDYRLQLEENGQLYWERWSERVLTTRTSHWLQTRLNHVAHSGWRLAPGFTLYVRKEWRHEQNAMGVEIKQKSGTFVSYGPMLRIQYAPTDKVEVVLDAIRRRVDPEGQRPYFINDLDMHIEYHF